MIAEKNVLVAMVKCGKARRCYGIRIEKLDNDDYLGTWAFSIKESSVKREGYDKTVIKGNIHFSKDYPGCPYCGTKQIVVCGCGRLGCSVLVGDRYKCEWCGAMGILVDYSGESISAGMDI